MATKTKAVPYDRHSVKTPKALSEEDRAALQGFYEKHREVIDDADALSQPMRAIAEFVKKELGIGEEEQKKINDA